MSGLLLKDIYCLLKQMKIFLVVVVIFAVMPGYSISTFAMVYGAVLPLSALAYDERSHWPTLAAMMPYSPRDLVLSKYVLGWLCMLTAGVTTWAVQTLLAAFGLPVTQMDLDATLPIICLALVMQAAFLPFMFKMGVEKGRMVFFALLALAAALGFLMETRLGGLGTALSSGWLAMVGLVLAANAVSLFISVQIYRRKQA